VFYGISCALYVEKPLFQYFFQLVMTRVLFILTSVVLVNCMKHVLGMLALHLVETKARKGFSLMKILQELLFGITHLTMLYYPWLGILNYKGINFRCGGLRLMWGNIRARTDYVETTLTTIYRAMMQG
jgi:hypothetical protein